MRMGNFQDKCPKIKDFVSISKKVHKPKILLLVNLRELHSHFKHLPCRGRNNDRSMDMVGHISLNVRPEFSFFLKSGAVALFLLNNGKIICLTYHERVGKCESDIDKHL